MDNLEQWTPEEPLFFNPCMQSRLLSSVSIRKCLLGNGITKLGHLLNEEGWIPTEGLKAVTGLRSSHLAAKLQEELCNTLPISYRTYIGQRHGTTQDRKSDEEFPGLRILPAVRTEEEDAVTDSILSFKAPQTSLRDMTKKGIYHITVKVLHKESLKRQKASRWPGMLNPDFLMRDSSPAKKVMLSNVPPFISDEAIGGQLDISGVTVPALISSGIVMLRELVNIAGTDLLRAEDLAARMGPWSLLVANQLLHCWRSTLTSEERVQLMDYQTSKTGPAEDGLFPQLDIAPDSSWMSLLTVREATPHFLGMPVREATPPLLGKTVREDTPPLLGKTVREATPPLLGKTVREAMPHFLGMTVREATPRLLGKTVREATPPLLGKTVREATPPLLGMTVREATPHFLGMPVREATPPLLGKTVREDTPPLLGKTVREATPPLLGKTVREAMPPFLGMTVREATPRLLGKTVREDTLPLLGKTVREATPPLLGMTIREATPHFLGMPVREATPPLLGKTVREDTPQLLGKTVREATPPFLGKSVREAMPPFLGMIVREDTPPFWGMTVREAMAPFLGMTVREATPPFLGMTVREATPLFLGKLMREGVFIAARTLTTTAFSAGDLQGTSGNWATVARRSRGGRRVHRQREKRKGKSVGLRIGTLNVGTLTGKGREQADMMERRKVDILCVQETRWKGSKARSIGAGFKLFYYGEDSKRNGVGVVLKEEFVRNVLEVKRVSDRVMSLKLEIEGVMLNVVSGYAPQVGCELEEKKRFWSAEVIRETGRKVLGVSSGRRKEDKETWWWNEEVQDSVQRKRLAKKKWDMDRTEENRQEYKELQRRVKREVSKAKQKAYDELYTRLDTREGEKDLYRLARQRDRDGKDVQQVRDIKDRDGRVWSEESVQRRWKEYFEELMNEENEREKRVEGVNSVEQKVDKIRKDEVRKALKRMKSGKAVGPDDIPVEVWKCLGEAAVEFLTSLFNRVLESERMPEEWRRSVLVPIFKNKGDVQSCSNYRGIKLMSHTMKLWEKSGS
ncbi:hypothetical protein QTP70_000183 [Hemibagrus guttatus]|uniref:Endonuclease/exonuclease/phosphatase domain-containing protein n=1 Tax=Hemibagrus guttatus TaxID=175788 RepID=A0AAE0Q3T0_9TELE|nr:hypothetical protein QTP70_000183 [Hemibagrus guttatus]